MVKFQILIYSLKLIFKQILQEKKLRSICENKRYLQFFDSACLTVFPRVIVRYCAIFWGFFMYVKNNSSYFPFKNLLWRHLFFRNMVKTDLCITIPRRKNKIGVKNFPLVLHFSLNYFKITSSRKIKRSSSNNNFHQAINIKRIGHIYNFSVKIIIFLLHIPRVSR